MGKLIKDLGTTLAENGSTIFEGERDTSYGLLLRDFQVVGYLSVALQDGDHSIVGRTSSGNVSPALSFGNGASHVWLSGASAWDDAHISGGDGDHAIKIESVGRRGATIELGHGSSVVVLGTSLGDINTTITGGNGDFKIRASDLGSVRLGNGDHVVRVGEARSITLGDGNSLVSFTNGADGYASTVTLGDGSHLIHGVEKGVYNTGAKITFGSGNTDLLLTGGHWNGTVISGGDGEHYLDVGETRSLQLGDGDSVVSFTNGADGYASTVTLGDGSHLIHGVEKGVYNTGAKITFGSGNTDLLLTGGLWNRTVISGGDGDHYLDVGETWSLQSGDGDSVVSFTNGADGYASTVTLGDGSHLIHGVEKGVYNTGAKITFGSGNTDLLLTGGHWNGTVISGGDGDHYLDVGETRSLQLGDGDSVVSFSNGADGDASTLTLGDGSHLIHGVEKGPYNTGAKITFGSGNTDLLLTGGLWNRTVISGGDGDHYLDVGETWSLQSGDGDSVVSFTNGADGYASTVTLGDGSHLIHGVEKGVYNTGAKITFGSGNTDLLLTGGHWNGTVISGGDGDHYLDVGETRSLQLGDGDSVVRYSDGADGYTSTIALGDGNHQIHGVEKGPYSTAGKITFGNGNTDLLLTDGLWKGTVISGGTGNNRIDASEARSVTVQDGNDWVSLSEGQDWHSATVATNGGDDVVVVSSVGSRARTKVDAGSGDDTIVLLNRFQGAVIDGGVGDDVLYVTSGTSFTTYAAYYGVYARGIETIVYIDQTSTIDNVIVLDGQNGIATGEVLDFSQSIDVTTQFETDPSVGEAGGPRDVPVTSEILQDFPTRDVPTYDFDLVAAPDVDGPGSAVLELVEYPQGRLAADTGPATREERLMESTDDFFVRVNAYELTYSSEQAETFYAAIQYNEFGDLTGTKSDDSMVDTKGDTQIFAMDGDDEIDGGTGDDRIYAGKGNDIVRGGSGQDLLDGGAGFDILIGGEGIDIFVFRYGEGTTVIEDFEMSFDVLDVEGFNGLTYEKLTESGVQEGDDVVYSLGDDTLILRDAELATMQEIDLCMK